MILKYCTLNGIDESSNLQDILQISRDYPFVEWGILVDGVDNSTPRFPSKDWIADFARSTPGLHKSLQISCERMTDVVEGVENIFQTYSLNSFQRVVFSFDLMAMPYHLVSRMIEWARVAPHIQFITLHNEGNQNVWKLFCQAGLTNHALLLDRSRKALPNHWTAPVVGIPCGYAGSICPGNIEDSLALLQSIVGEGVTWIDILSGVRDADNRFDFNLAEQCLMFVSRYTLDRTVNNSHI